MALRSKQQSIMASGVLMATCSPSNGVLFAFHSIVTEFPHFLQCYLYLFKGKLLCSRALSVFVMSLLILKSSLIMEIKRYTSLSSPHVHLYFYMIKPLSSTSAPLPLWLLDLTSCLKRPSINQDFNCKRSLLKYRFVFKHVIDPY